MSFEKLPQVEKIHVGCLNCSTAALVAPMEMSICVGFGFAHLEKDGELVYDGEAALSNDEEPWTVSDAEKLAVADPDHDWRIVKYGPLHGETFQRQGESNWVCVESNQGFA